MASLNLCWSFISSSTGTSAIVGVFSHNARMRHPRRQTRDEQEPVVSVSSASHSSSYSAQSSDSWCNNLSLLSCLFPTTCSILPASEGLVKAEDYTTKMYIFSPLIFKPCSECQCYDNGSNDDFSDKHRQKSLIFSEHLRDWIFVAPNFTLWSHQHSFHKQQLAVFSKIIIIKKKKTNEMIQI